MIINRFKGALQRFNVEKVIRLRSRFKALSQEKIDFVKHKIFRIYQMSNGTIDFFRRDALSNLICQFAVSVKLRQMKVASV